MKNGQIFAHKSTARGRLDLEYLDECSNRKAQHDALVSAGINPDQVLHSTMKKMMRKFAEKFHPGDAIGFAYGLHHDTAHPHVHVTLCPRTAKGNYVGCSTSRFSQSKHKRQVDLIRSWFQEENTRWEKILSSPQRIEETIAKRLDSDRLAFSPRLNHLQANAIQCARNHEAFQFQQLYQNIRTLENSLAARGAKLTAERNSRHIARIMRSRSSRVMRLAHLGRSRAFRKRKDRPSGESRGRYGTHVVSRRMASLFPRFRARLGGALDRVPWTGL